ncbi:hypothetical protein HGRIS_002694 [Hohenbuehelia grisea]|uniref:Mitochondrial carrier n=1 Tax=Hohenbuehelia grisea TaxID=104357 RepID=A0ABR3JM03_9AGAR
MRLSIGDFLILFLSLGLSLAFIVPFTGVLVRFRANYSPKSLQLDPEDGAEPHTGPVVSTYFGMLVRVYRLEGRSGLFKGFMPTLLTTLVMTLAVLILDDSPRPKHGRYRSPDIGILGVLAYGIAMTLVGLPSVILTYRAITTPYKLPYLKPMVALRVLLTPTERRRPWLLYLTPGLFIAECAHVGYVVLVLGTLRRLLLPVLSQPGLPKPSDFPPFKVGTYVALVCISAIILTPLEVIATRLAIQRNHAESGYNSVSQEVDGDVDGVPEYPTEEEVIGLRSETDPYNGLRDCAQRIIQEEGWRALYRGWWITMLGGLAALHFQCGEYSVPGYLSWVQVGLHSTAAAVCPPGLSARLKSDSPRDQVMVTFPQSDPHILRPGRAEAAVRAALPDDIIVVLVVHAAFLSSDDVN